MDIKDLELAALKVVEARTNSWQYDLFYALCLKEILINEWLKDSISFDSTDRKELIGEGLKTFLTDNFKELRGIQKDFDKIFANETFKVILNSGNTEQIYLYADYFSTVYKRLLIWRLSFNDFKFDDFCSDAIDMVFIAMVELFHKFVLSFDGEK